MINLCGGSNDVERENKCILREKEKNFGFPYFVTKVFKCHLPNNCEHADWSEESFVLIDSFDLT